MDLVGNVPANGSFSMHKLTTVRWKGKICIYLSIGWSLFACLL